MGLELRLRATTRQTIAQRCATCNFPIGEKPNPEATEDVNLCGAEKYVVCPTCNKVVPEELRTAAYKSVWSHKNGERIRQQIVNHTAFNVKRQEDRITVTPKEWLRDRREFELQVMHAIEEVEE